SAPFFTGLLETQSARADRDAISVLELMFKLRLTVYENFVRAAPELSVDDCAVDNREGAVVGLIYVSVVTRSAWIIKHDRIVGRAANRASDLRRKAKLPLATTGVGNFEMSHGRAILTVES